MAREGIFFENVTSTICIKKFSEYSNHDFFELDIEGTNDLELKVKVYPCVGNYVSVYIAKETASKPFSTLEIECVARVIGFENAPLYSQFFSFYNSYNDDVFIFGKEKCFNIESLLDEELVLDDVLYLQINLTYKGKIGSKPISNIAKTLGTWAENLQERHDQKLLKNPAQNLIDVPGMIRKQLKSIPTAIRPYSIAMEQMIVETMDGVQHKIPIGEEPGTLGSKLRIASPWFNSILSTPMLESITNKVKINYDSPTFSSLLDFIQNEKVNWSLEIEDTYSLYEMADEFRVLDLMKKCSRHLAHNINKENVVEISKLAIMHSDSHLRENTASFFTGKDIWIVGRISSLVLSQVKKLKLKLIPKSFEVTESFESANYLEKQVFLVKGLEDACILYEIADKSTDLSMSTLKECARYIKKNINIENASVVLNCAKRCRNPLPLSFVIDCLEHKDDPNIDVDIQKTFGTLFALSNGMSSTCSEESVYFSCDSDTEEMV